MPPLYLNALILKSEKIPSVMTFVYYIAFFLFISFAVFNKFSVVKRILLIAGIIFLHLILSYLSLNYAAESFGEAVGIWLRRNIH
jgi:hypothetical protein